MMERELGLAGFSTKLKYGVYLATIKCDTLYVSV